MLPSQMQRVMLSVLGSQRRPFHLDLPALQRIWSCAVTSQERNPDKSGVIARWAVGSAAYCPKLSTREDWREVRDMFLNLEEYEVINPHDASTEWAQWLILKGRVYGLSSLAPDGGN